VNVTASNEGLALISILIHASLVVQLVMLLLLAASLVSWTMIFRKRATLRAAGRAAEDFESRFWSGSNLSQMFKERSGREDNLSGMDSVFVAGFKEYSRLEKQRGIQPNEILEGVQRAMRVALSREIDYLETHLSFLATVGSISPYVGLFGTVWGIMHSFQGLSTMQQATIASVAPGIAEALIATAMGLFAAIPAVIAYNHYSNDVERLVTRYQIFMEEFASILQRQAFLSKV
jgi:biopolymer transport protein TolQ